MGIRTALLFVSLLVFAAAAPVALPAGPSAARAWKLVWSDGFDGTAVNTVISMRRDDAGFAGKSAPIQIWGTTAGDCDAVWSLPATWNSGNGWRKPRKSVGTRRVQLPAGCHKLVLLCDDISPSQTFFSKLIFTSVQAPIKE